MSKWDWTVMGKIPQEELDKDNTLHFCPDWDELVISSSDPEFLCCTCFTKEELCPKQS